MAKGVNKVLLIGNLGSDPVVRYTTRELAVASFSIATSTVSHNKQSGETREHTEWHRLVLFDKLAEIAGEYLKKGSKIFVEGRLQTRKWQDKNGLDRLTTEIVVTELQMLDGRSSDQDATTRHTAQKNTQTDALPHEFEDDDIPF